MSDVNDEIGRMGDKTPRVHIKYRTKTDEGIKLVEIPFIIGVLAGLSGNAKKSLPDVGDRKFQKVTKQTFDRFLSDISPEVEFEVPYALSDARDAKQDEKLKVKLTIRSMKDFDPGTLVELVPILKELMAEREANNELLQRLGNRDVQKKVLGWLQDSERRAALQATLQQSAGN